MSKITKQQFLAFNFPFLAVHPDPELEATAINISDCGSLTAFEEKWWKEPKEVQSEFGYTLPVFMGDAENPITCFDRDPKEYHILYLITVPYARYIQMVKDYAKDQRYR